MGGAFESFFEKFINGACIEEPEFDIKSILRPNHRPNPEFRIYV